MAWLAPAARAQSASSASVLGQITDQQHAAVVGAVITLTNTATGASQATIANAQGRYSFINIPPGTYSLDVKKQGFKEAAVKNQLATVGRTLNINIPMQVGETTQTVEVTATGAELETMNSTVGDTISGSAILLAPNMSRDANSLTTLQPNTSTYDGGVAGADADQNSYTLDGGNNSDDMDGNHADYNGTQGGLTSGTIPVPADSIEQFTIGVNNQTADVNSAAGSTVSMVTKAGTPVVHGSAYDYYLGSYLAANDWSNNQANVARPKNHQNRFGASLGGPLGNWLGGKTFIFGLFEGLRYPGSIVNNHATPSDLMRAGVIQVSNGAAGYEAYNLNPTSVTVAGTTYPAATCNVPGGATPTAGNCDPLGLGANKLVQALWKQYMPEPNNFTSHTGDLHNTYVYSANLQDPLASNFFVTRIDHDFGAKNHFDGTYHFFSYNPVYTSGQVDIGGGVPGDTFGVPTATTVRPQLPSMWTAALTTNLSSNLTNAFRYSYLRNFWQWGGADVAPQTVAGFGTLGGALEIGGESRSGSLIPYNVNAQNVRSRVWDGIGHTFGDDLSDLHGNHLFQFGGKFTHQMDHHTRNDNGGGIMAANVYISAYGGGVSNTYLPTDFVGSSTTYDALYNEVLGIVTQPQSLYTRSGPQLNLQPLGTPMFDDSYIPMYNAYFSDSWHMRPNLTLTYGAGYTVEMPPNEKSGKQVELVDSTGNLVTTSDYLAATERAALGGQNFNPELGYATVGNVGGGLKYPYHPFYGGLSPRVALAWNPNFQGGILGSLFGANKTVIRGGWARIYGRLNGVDLVLVPLLGTGLGQPVSCIGASASGACLGNAGVTPADAFRIGPKGVGNGMTAPLGATPTPTLPQPFFPGEIQNGAVNAAAGAGDFLDPNFRPNRSDEFDITIQRQISPNFTTQIGYTGRVIRNEFQEIDLDAVPYMMTAGGQQFQQAFANVWKQMAAGATTFNPQSFFETALGGANSAFCKGYANCTSAVAAAYGPSGSDYMDPTTYNNVYSMWAAMNASPSWTLGRTYPSAPTTCAAPGQGGCPANGSISPGGQLSAVFSNDSLGWGNYNSMFWSVNMRNWHGLTAVSNFTWSRSFGTGQVDQASSEYTVSDPYNLHTMYGPQNNDIPIQYNLYFVYQPGSQTQHGMMGHLAHGWSFAPILTYSDGGWTDVSTSPNEDAGGFGGCAAFGEGDCSAEYTNEFAVKTSGFSGGSGVAANVAPTNFGSDSASSNGGTGMNRFGANPGTIASEFRPLVLGIDTTSMSGLYPALGHWNVDFSLTKDLAVSERFGAQLSAQARNVFNHFAPSEEGPSMDYTGAWGAISGNTLRSREVEVGLRLHW